MKKRKLTTNYDKKELKKYMNKEFNLSEKMLSGKERRNVKGKLLFEAKNVKEFIKKIEEINIWYSECEWMCIKRKDLFELVGDKLSK